MGCEAHNLLTEELNRVKDDISEIYTLDRVREKTMSEIKEDVTELKVKQNIMNEDIKALKVGQAELDNKVTKLDKTVSTINETTNNMQNDIKSIKTVMNDSKWQPKDYVVIIVALLSLAGTIITALIK